MDAILNTTLTRLLENIQSVLIGGCVCWVARGDVPSLVHLASRNVSRPEICPLCLLPCAQLKPIIHPPLPRPAEVRDRTEADLAQAG